MYMADQAPVDEDMRSVALPFAAKPVNLNGELAGDVGFDPFKFSDKGDVAKFRVAELKHGTFTFLLRGERRERKGGVGEGSIFVADQTETDFCVARKK